MFLKRAVLLAIVMSGASSMIVARAQAPPAGQPDRGRAPSAAGSVTDRLRALQQEAEVLATQEKTILVELRKLEVERQMKAEELARIDRDVRQTRRMIEETSARAASLRQTVAVQRPDVEARLVQLYKFGRGGPLRLMLDVEDVRSVGRAYRAASALSRIDRDRVREHQRALESLDQQQKDLEARAKQLARLQADAAGARQALDRTVAARAALVASIDARRDLNAQLTGELQAAQQRLQTSVAQLESGRSAPDAVPLVAARGTLPWPVRGTVARRFGQQSTGRFRSGVSRNGIEIAAGEGLAVRAVHEGTVAFAGQFTGYGNLVIVDHGDGAFSLYGYLEALRVARGDHVDGQAELGASGRAPDGSPALYFELRVDGRPVDPLQWLRRTP
jgi:septal ring factor EnvC (AmiA/AmiB activator)